MKKKKGSVLNLSLLMFILDLCPVLNPQLYLSHLEANYLM